MTQHIWIDNNRYQVTDDFDRTPGSADMKALAELDKVIVGHVADPAFQAELERQHTDSHARRCCTEHGTHSTPHKGCILR